MTAASSESSFFLSPQQALHRQYEALRAYFVEVLSSKEAAERFGYSAGAFRVLCHQFRHDPVKREFFRTPRHGPQNAPARDAVRAVPYYRDLFAGHGVGTLAELTDDVFSRLPISSRRAVQEAGSRLESTALPTDHGVPEYSTTSGSSGRPLRFALTAVTRTLWLAFALREHLWHARDFTAKLGAIRPSLHRHYSASPVLRASPPPRLTRSVPHGLPVGLALDHATGFPTKFKPGWNRGTLIRSHHVP